MRCDDELMSLPPWFQMGRRGGAAMPDTQAAHTSWGGGEVGDREKELQAALPSVGWIYREGEVPMAEDQGRSGMPRNFAS